MSRIKNLSTLQQNFKYSVDHSCILFSQFLYESLCVLNGVFNSAESSVIIKTKKKSFEMMLRVMIMTLVNDRTVFCKQALL